MGRRTLHIPALFSRFLPLDFPSPTGSLLKKNGSSGIVLVNPHSVSQSPPLSGVEQGGGSSITWPRKAKHAVIQKRRIRTSRDKTLFSRGLGEVSILLKCDEVG
jgi:hypothetical protein